MAEPENRDYTFEYRPNYQEIAKLRNRENPLREECERRRFLRDAYRFRNRKRYTCRRD